MTPTVTMNYFGTRQLQIFSPNGTYPKPGLPLSRFNYNWTEVGDPSLFPSNCQLWVASENAALAYDVYNHSLSDSRIIAGWVNDYSVGDWPVSIVKSIHDNLHGLPLYVTVCIDKQGTSFPYWREDHATWAELSPYIDGIMFNCLPRIYDTSSYDSQAYYDAIKDMATILPGKDIICQLFNYHYNYGVYSWSDYSDFMATAAQLHAEGIVSHVTILAAFWTQWVPLATNYMRNYLETEMGNAWATTINLNTLVVSSTKNGVSCSPAVKSMETKWTDNYTLLSMHTQTVTLANAPSTHMAVKSLRTGRMTDVGSSTFVLRQGEPYQLLSWPHTDVTYSSDVTLSTTTVWADKDILFEKNLTINANLTADRCRFQFGTNRYNDTIANLTSPGIGIDIKHTGDANITIILQNVTVQGILTQFPYFLNARRSNDYQARVWTIANSSFNGFCGFEPNGYVTVTDSIFGASTWDGTSSNSGMHLMMPGCSVKQYWLRNIFYNCNRWSTVSFLVFPGNAYYDHDFGYLRVENNTIVGSRVDLQIDVGWSAVGAYSVLKDLQIYREDYNATGDDIHANEWPPAYHWGVLDVLTNDRIKITADDANWYSRKATVTTQFEIDSTVDFNGTLKDANGATIGAYSSTAHEIHVTGINDTYMDAGTITHAHPWPWTFTVTSALSSSYYWGIASYGTLGVNRSTRYDPWLLPISSKTVTFYPEDATSLHLIQLDKETYSGVPTTIHSDGMIDMGEYLLAWTQARYRMPEQIPLYIDTSGTVEVNVTTYMPTAPLVAAWTATGTSGTAVFTMTDLTPSTIYTIYVDAVHVATITSSVAGMISFPYSGWSTHTFQVYRPTTYDSDDTTDGGSGDRSPSSSETGSSSLSLSSLSVIAIASASVLILVVVLIRRPRGRSGKRYS